MMKALSGVKHNKLSTVVSERGNKSHTLRLLHHHIRLQMGARFLAHRVLLLRNSLSGYVVNHNNGDRHEEAADA